MTLDTISDASGGCPASGQANLQNAPESCPMSELANNFDPFDAPYQSDPAQSLAWARDQNPVFYAPKIGYWVVSRFDDVKAVFRDNILFSPSIALEKIVPFSDTAMDILKSYDYKLNRTMVNEDEPTHTERRRALMDHFIPENLKARESMIRTLTTRYIDNFIEKGESDLVADMLWEIPLSVALNFLGVPEEDIDTLREFCTAHMVNTWGKPTPEEQENVARAVGEFWKYSGKVLAKMRNEPDGKGWMHFAIQKQKDLPEIITDSYLHSMMMAIIVAAHETTSHGTANALRMLLGDRDAWQNIIEDPALIPNAVEECLRISGSVVAWRRLATDDAVIGGVDIPRGAKLLIVTASANHDQRHFENPEMLDIYRENAVDHLTFGYGSHQCMGKNLARMEMRIFIEELSRRIPDLRLAEGQEFSFQPNISFRGPNNLWVKWDPSLHAKPSSPPQNFVIGPPIKADIARKMVVSNIENSGEGIRVFTLKDPKGRPLRKWSAGAHIDVLAGDFSRKYSLCGAQSKDDSFQIAVLHEADGRGGSRYMHEKLAVGDIVKIRGPKNHFRLRDNDRHKILIAGGIGITPILAMADDLKANKGSFELHYCCRSSAHMVFGERLLRDHSGALKMHYSDTQTRIDLARVVQNAGEGPQIYACGPARMLDELQNLTAHLPAGRLVIEHFTAIAIAGDEAAEQGFNVRLRDTGIELVVPANQSLLEVLQNQGIDLPYDCGEGLCGSCEVMVHAGQVEHRDSVLSNSEKQANTKMMACCSRGRDGETLTIGL